MRSIFTIEPDGWPCTLADCPPGFFVFEGSLCSKSEYLTDGNIEAFNCAGEAFWGGTSTQISRISLVVQPVVMTRKEVFP